MGRRTSCGHPASIRGARRIGAGKPFEDIDAGVFFGRDVAIVRGLDELRAMRLSGTESLFVVLGPSGSGKSSFLRAGLIPRLQRDDRHFLVLGIMRPERNALSGTLAWPRPSTQHAERRNYAAYPLARSKKRAETRTTTGSTTCWWSYARLPGSG